MAFLGIGKKKEAPKGAGRSTQKAVESKKPRPATRNPQPATSSSILIRPRITEKSGNLTARRVYTFDVRVDATKRTIARAVEAMYNVTPSAIRIVSSAPRRVRLRTRRGFGKTVATKKAYVSVKPGDRIEFSS